MEDGHGRSARTVARAGLWRALTPQMFRYGLLRRALALCIERERARHGRGVGDRGLGLRPRLVPGRADNIKVTTPADAASAEAILRAGRRTMRVGTVTTCTRSGPGDHVMLGGVRIAHDRGVVAHSDGDVLLHALCDALLGAMGLGDIGEHFPDTRPALEGRRQPAVPAPLRASCWREHGWRLVNADLTVIAEAPRLGAHRPQMRARIASDLGCASERINIKATTHEGLGALGRARRPRCQAIVLLARARRIGIDGR